ncbi:MAG TPA: hypothetical protein VF544_20925 [Pyrinomonadaceae bacterium]|jgi:hypothetical protein
MRSIKDLARSFATRRRVAGCLLLLFALCMVAFAQSSEPQAIDPWRFCPDIDMCVVDPETGQCMGIPCPPSTPSPVATPTPLPSPKPPPPGSTPFLISEFRFRGPAGENDEFIEIYNNSNGNITVNAADGSAGWALVASDGIVRFVIPNGIMIPPRGHFLAVNALGYSLGSYPAGEDRGATADISYLLDIPDKGGIALFRTTNPQNFTTWHRIDAVGYETAPALYREGAGFPAYGAETFIPLQYSFYRDLTAGVPKDTQNNTADFMGVDPNFYNTSAGQHLGAPGPENLSSPVNVGGRVQLSLLDPAVSSTADPNRVRSTFSDPENNSTYGTLSIRRTVTNISATNITRLRFRIVSITTFPAMSPEADIRFISSYVPFNVMISDGTIKTVKGTVLETPPAQPNGGGYNSSMRAEDVTLAEPLAPGQSINLQFLLGVQQSGTFRFNIVVETL